MYLIHFILFNLLSYGNKKDQFMKKSKIYFQESQIYYAKIKDLINQLLTILKDNFPEDCSYVKKLNALVLKSMQ